MKETVSDGLAKFGGELIPKVIRCSVLKRAIGDFQRGPGGYTFIQRQFESGQKTA